MVKSTLTLKDSNFFSDLKNFLVDDDVSSFCSDTLVRFISALFDDLKLRTAELELELKPPLEGGKGFEKLETLFVE